MEKPTSNQAVSVDIFTFSSSVTIIILCTIGLILFPETSAEYAGTLRNIITYSLDWLFLLVGVVSLVFALWLALGPYGHIKLGDPDEGPEYSNVHWIAMMFTAGIGGGLVVWGFAEPIFYLATPPFGIEPFSNEAREWAHMYPMFHWGILPWAMYLVPAVPIAYMLYVRKERNMRISSACDPVLPKTGRSQIKSAIDLIIIMGIVGGTATALGLGVPFISALASELLNINDSTLIKLIILAIWTLLFSLSVSNGLKKGIKILADINMGLAALVILFILLVGPTLFILEMTVNSLGLMFDNFIAMAFWTDPLDKSGFPETWTVFYWAWWISFAAFVGLFIARISRGRTIKQLVLGVLCWGSLGTWIFLATAGAYALHLEINGILDVSEILANDGMSVTVAKILATLPFNKVVLLIFIVLGVVFSATNVDSAAYILASICSKDLPNDREPQLWNRLVWALLLALLTVGLVVADALPAVLSATIISAVPLIPIMFLMCWSTVKWLKKHKIEHDS